MRRADLERPMRRALALAAITLGPPLVGALLFGARPPALLAVAGGANLFGALVFPMMLNWTPAVAFGLVLVPSLFAALAVFEGIFFVVHPVVVAVSAMALFYRPVEERRRDGPARRGSSSTETSFNPDGSRSSRSADAGYAGGGGAFAGAGASGAWVASQAVEPSGGGDSAGDSAGGEGGGGGGGD